MMFIYAYLLSSRKDHLKGYGGHVELKEDD